MLTFLTNNSPLLDCVADDPVRPELSKEFRIAKNRFVSCLVDGSNVDAMVCISLHDFIPASVKELENTSDNYDTAIFYTIWSYKSGAGIKLLRSTVDEIKVKYPQVKRFVTLSPPTELARRFHIRNGAVVFRENETTVNYEYIESEEI